MNTDTPQCSIQLQVMQDPDVVEVGTPSRGGIKVHLDCNNLEAARKKLDNAFSILSHALYQYEVCQSAAKANREKAQEATL